MWICLFKCVLRTADKKSLSTNNHFNQIQSYHYDESTSGFQISGFNHERHVEFLKYLENELGTHAFVNDRTSQSYDLTINQMKTSGKLLLITYNQPDMEKGLLTD